MNELEQANNIKSIFQDNAVKILLSSIPVGGPLIQAVFDASKEYTLNKRQQEWRDNIEHRLSKVEKDITEVGNNELFVTALMTGTYIAMKTSEHEKRNYLANGILNSLNESLDETKLIIFLNLVDKYSLWHIKLLKFFQNPLSYSNAKKVYDNIYMGGRISLVKAEFPDLCKNEELFKKIYNDLINDRLVSVEVNGVIMKEAFGKKWTTGLADIFLDFISEKAEAIE